MSSVFFVGLMGCLPLCQLFCFALSACAFNSRSASRCHSIASCSSCVGVGPGMCLWALSPVLAHASTLPSLLVMPFLLDFICTLPSLLLPFA
jgi:hypothetical protein